MREGTSGDRPIFVGGAGRSGTTLLRVMLNAHPHLCGGPEFKATPAIAAAYRQLVGFPDVLRAYGLGRADAAARFGSLLRDLLDPLRVSRGDVRIVEKTPHNVLFIPELAEMLPEARFLHVVRDGRDVSSSLMAVQWRDASGEIPWYCRSLENGFRYWTEVVTAGLRHERSPQFAGRIASLRYEDLVRRPEAVMRAVLRFLDEPWSDRVLEYTDVARPHDVEESSSRQVERPLYATSIGRWRTGADAEAVAMFKKVGGPLLIELGYEKDAEW